MPQPTGTWTIDANGFKGTLNFNPPIPTSPGILSGTIDIDIGFTDTLQGVWSDLAQEIVFNRIRIQGRRIVWIQTYTGYLILTNEPIFSGVQGPPPPIPDVRLLTGEFVGIGAGSSPGRPRFGWAARQPIER